MENMHPQNYMLLSKKLFPARLLKEWLWWSDTTFSAENLENRRSFYDLLIQHTIDGVIYPPKLKDVRQVRKLKDIVNKPQATEKLLNPESSLEDAINEALIRRCQ